MQDPSILYSQSNLEWEEYQNVQALSQEYDCSTSADFKQLLDQGYSELELTRRLLEATRVKLSKVQSQTSKPAAAWKVILSSRTFWLHFASVSLLLVGGLYVYSYSSQPQSSQATTQPAKPH